MVAPQVAAALLAEVAFSGPAKPAAASLSGAGKVRGDMARIAA